MLTSVMRLTILLCIATAALMADWKVYIDKKPRITGLRSAHADLNAKGLGTATLVVTMGNPFSGSLTNFGDLT